MVHDLRNSIATAKRAGVLVAVATDLLSLTVLTPPGEMGADVVLGNYRKIRRADGLHGEPHRHSSRRSRNMCAKSPGTS